MKTFSLIALVCLGAAVAQTPPAAAPPTSPTPSVAEADIPGDTVVAMFDDGVTLTMDGFRKIVAGLPPQYQAAAQNRATFLQQYGLTRKIAQLAEQDKLDQESPLKEQLAFSRMMALMMAKANKEVNATVVPSEEIAKFYDQNKENFKEVKTKAIYIAFSKSVAPPASSNASRVKKTLTEDEARAKALKLLGDIRAGADFVKLVKENSDDDTSKAKDGDFTTFKPSDMKSIPEDFKTVLSLKQGEVTEPVRQSSGFYLLRAEQVNYAPLSDVRDGIYQQLRQEHFDRWMRQMYESIHVTFPNPAFLGNTPAGPIPPPAGPAVK